MTFECSNSSDMPSLKLNLETRLSGQPLSPEIGVDNDNTSHRLGIVFSTLHTSTLLHLETAAYLETTCSKVPGFIHCDSKKTDVCLVLHQTLNLQLYHTRLQGFLRVCARSIARALDRTWRDFYHLSGRLL